MDGELKLNGEGLGDGSPSVARPTQVGLIGQRPPVRDPSTVPIESQLDRIEHRRLAASVQGADDDEPALLPLGREGDLLTASVGTEILEGELVENHAFTSSKTSSSSAEGFSHASPVLASCRSRARLRASSWSE